MFSKTQVRCLTIFFGCFVVFLYGPVLSIILLAFQGPEGGLTFPMRVSLFTGSKSCGVDLVSLISPGDFVDPYFSGFW